MTIHTNTHKRLEEDVREMYKLIMTNKDEIRDKAQSLDIRISIIESNK